jgi:hypothetical protein
VGRGSVLWSRLDGCGVEGGDLIWQVERCDVIEISRTCYSCCDVGEPGSEMCAL